MSRVEDRSIRSDNDETTSHVESLGSASTSASRRARLQIQLQRLEAEQAIQKKKAAIEIEAEFTRKKYEALEASIADDAASVRSKISKGRSEQQVRDWMENSYQVAPGVHEEQDGAVGGEIGKTDPEKDQTKPNTLPPAAKMPAYVESMKREDDPGIRPLGQNSSSEEVEDLRRMLEQYKTLYLAEKERNRRQPSVPDRTTKGAYPKAMEMPNLSSSRPTSSTPKPAGESQSLPKRQQQLTSYSATDMRQDVNEVMGQITDAIIGSTQDSRTANTGRGNVTFASDIRNTPDLNNVRRNEAVAVANDDSPEDVQMRPQVPIFPVALGPTPQQLAARQILPRDLPTFAGNPADWPVFISQYSYTTQACGYSDGENMIRLQRCLKGAAWEATRSRLILPASVPHVIEALRMRYGRSELLIETLIERVRGTPSPKADKLNTIIEYGTKIQTLCDHITAANLLDHLGNPTLLKDLVEKLPAEYKMRWASYRKNRPLVNLQTFGEYMEEVVADACSVSSYGGSENERFTKCEKRREHDRTFLHSDTGATSSAITKSSMNRPVESNHSFECLVCKKTGHRVRDCTTFKALSTDERWKRVQNLGLCRTCLYNHGRRSCRINNRCGVNGCLTRHHPLLHSYAKDATISNTPVPNDHHFHNRDIPSLLFRIIPVVLYNGTSKIAAYAFLDEGSNISMIERRLAATLNVTGYRQPLCLKWTGNVTREESESHRITIEISGTEQQAPKYIMSEVGTVDSLDLPKQSLPIEQLAGRFRHLRGLPIQEYRNVTPQLLIGVDNLKLAVPLKVKEGNEGPTAVKTRLGWCVYGGHRDEGQLSVNYHVCECSEGDTLDKTLKAYFSLEEVGIRPAGVEMSNDEERALRILQQTTKRIDHRYESGLLWKYDDFEFPDSYPMAVKRLQCLERRLDKDPALNKNVRQQIHEYEQKGYAHRASLEELNSTDLRRVWYLPLGAVTNPRKPGKVRLIWDASAKVDGVSLNSMLLKGPDQMTLLPAVLFRFRQYPIAVSADIKEMFHQVRIRSEDRHSQRFVYRADPTSPPETYLMDVATFGSTCSPATAQFVKNTNARQFSQECPRAVQGIIHNHYVDDYLDSFATTEEAAEVTSQVKTIHKHGGFEIRNWCSNQRAVLEHLGEVEQQTVIDLNSGMEKQSERVLGILWDTRADEFRFNTSFPEDITHLREHSIKPTKRQLARCVMSFFDPQGFLAPYLIFGKVLLQDTWREGTGWDEQICDGTFERWKQWMNMLDSLKFVKIPRCYFSTGDLTTLEIHTFVDASEMAYSCVSYFRITNAYGPAELAFVAAKTKVTPLKPVTIPRLELMACVLGVRLAKYVVEGHSVPVRKQFFWSDSEVALSWIKADPRKYRPFVAFRVGEILEKSHREEWRWVSSKLNPADEATKWGSGPYFNKNSIWYDGPAEFLRYPEHQWPLKKVPGIVVDEIRACCVHRKLQGTEQLLDIERFSSWKKVLRILAYVCRFLSNCRSPGAGKDRTIGHLTKAEYQKAEQHLFRAVQWESYADEIATLTNNQRLPQEKRQPLERTSTLFKISPILDAAGVLRMDSRISAARNVPAEMKFPVILPKRHRLTLLVLEDLHRKLLHANNEAVVNEARQRYYIAQLRTQVRLVSNQCILCKIRRAKPAVPRMAALPSARLSAYVRPFTYCGLDYFGPLLVKVNRSHVKRWVAIFTCLTIRAVHVEVIHTLTTESCIKGVRRFICRRGSPAEIYSDNATCFHGADRVLREQINKGLAAKFTSTQTEWKFIPPGTPHMGGAWERMVRSVKVALASIQGGVQKLDDESLLTFLTEAEAIVNCRPLTYLPLDSAEQEALTPNHFLLGSSSGVRLAPVQTIDEVSLLKGSWTTIQKYLDIFWKRWTREYLPTLTKRTKWFDEVKPIQPGDLVLIIDDTKRNGWVRGRVLEVLPAADGRVRQAIVQTAGNAPARRPISKLAVLEISKGTGTEDSTGSTWGEDVAKLATSPGRNQSERTSDGTGERAEKCQS